MSGLPRDILKWLQSLDLTYSVKNAKRDFSNGFLVAEILSRFFPQEVQMHSFDNGSALNKKLDNWDQIVKFCDRKQISIPHSLIDEVVHCKDGAALPLLQIIYTSLTNRPAAKVIKPQTDEELIPPFARATATALIRETIKDSELKTVLADQNTNRSKTKEILSKHNEALRDEKLSDPQRFTARTEKRIPPKQVASSQDDVPQVQFLEIQVKQVDRAVSQLRVSSERSAAASQAASALEQSVASLGSTPAVSAHRAQQPPQLPKFTPVMTTLKDIVNETMKSDMGEMQKLDLNKERAVGFVEALAKGDIAPKHGTTFHASIVARAAELIDAFVNVPKEFWVFISLQDALLRLPDAHPLFGSTVSMICSLAAELQQRDAFASFMYCSDYVLPKMVPLLKTRPEKRPTLLALCYSFVADSAAAHIPLLKVLQEKLDDFGVFVLCLAVLSQSEHEWSDNLLDLYIYYTIQGLSAESASLRSASVAILRLVGRDRPSLVLPILPRLEAMTKDPWWESQAQLLMIGANLLRNLSPSHPDAQRVYDIVQAVLSKSQSPLVRKIGPKTKRTNERTRRSLNRP